jgi:antitoxin (DNA-binding transcriptional repressor) of toxin-antitoxin stability system
MKRHVVRKTFLLDPGKVSRAQKVLGAASEAEAIRMALDKVIDEVKDRHIVTRHGTPVAKIAPVGTNSHLLKRARSLLLARLQAQPVMEIEHWTGEGKHGR